MPIRLNDIESRLRIGAEEALASLDAVGKRVDGFGGKLAKADRDLGKFGRGINQAAQASAAGFRLIESTSGRSLGAVEAATTGVLNAAGQTAIVAGSVGNLTGAVSNLTKGVGGLSTALSIGLAGGLILVLGLLAKFAIDLNRISAETEKINDAIAKAPALAKARAESAALAGTVRQLEAGTLSAAEAQEEFNRFGLESVEQARQRIDVLDGVIDRLTREKAAEDAANKSKSDRLALEKELIDRAESRRKAAEIEIAEEEALRKFQESLPPAVLPAAEQPPAEGIGGLEGLDKLNKALPTLKTSITDLFDAADLGGAKFVLVLSEAEKKLIAAGEASARFEQHIAGLAAGALEGLATLGGDVLVDIGNGFRNAGEIARSFFSRLFVDLGKAIIRALILKAILAAVGGPTSFIGKALGGLFQDPTADLFARFEGRRFADLFFEGVNQQVGAVQSRLETTLEENRDVRDTQDRPFNVLVNEASPETTVEITDRKIEPRVRERAAQRTTSTTPTLTT